MVSKEHQETYKVSLLKFQKTKEEVPDKFAAMLISNSHKTNFDCIFLALSLCY